ncbi:MAG: DctP family TRAP transporter solute-binding subunit, partial [Armatimonadota bacterium]|nr:DctP family TRAP transporter solute-binding subunit [Armatimonadota bacterium]
MRLRYAAVALVSLVLVTAGGPVGAAVLLRWGEVLPADHPSVQMVYRVARRVAEATQGRVTIQVFPAGQLGSTRDQIENVILGTQHMTTEGAAAISQFVPALGVIEAPYIWRDVAHLAKVMEGPVGQELSRQLVEKAGIRVLGTTYYGVRHLTTSTKPVRTVADMREFKLRVPENDVFLAMARAWGAKPTPMAFGELYLALKLGVVDGQENPLPTIDSGKFYEVQKYLVLTGHILTPRLVLINERSFRTLLSATDQAALVEAVAEGIAWQNQQIQVLEGTLTGKFRRAGME